MSANETEISTVQLKNQLYGIGRQVASATRAQEITMQIISSFYPFPVF